MKAATVIAVAVAAFSSLPSAAHAKQDQQHPQAVVSQQQNPTSPANPSSPAQQPSEPMSTPPQTGSQQGANANPNTSAIQLQPVKGELEGRLDSKSARQGDSVVVETEESVKTANGTEIPKGSKLVGHVTNVMARGDGKQNSQIAIQFDRAELRGGQNLPIESVIQSVAPAAGEEMNSNTAPMPGAATSAPNTPNGSATGNPETNNAPNRNMANGRPGTTGNTMAQPGEQNVTVTSGAPAPGSIVARTGNVAIRTTSIPGILIASDINGRPFLNASGLLLGARRDIKLEGGTQMVVAVAEVPSGMSR